MKNSMIILTLSLFILLPIIVFAQSITDNKQPSCQMVKDKIAGGSFLVDVRTAEEFQSGNLAGSINVPYDQIESKSQIFPSDKRKEIVLYCKSGRRAELGKKSLTKLGYENVINAGTYDDLFKCWSHK